MSVNNCKTLAPDTARKQWHKRDFVEGLAVLHARQDILTSATAKPAKVSDERWHWAACREVQNLGTSWLLTVKTGACNVFCGNACTSSLGNSTPVVQNAKSQPESCGSYRHPRQEKGIGMASVKKLDVSFSNFSNAVKWKASNCLWHERLWVSLHWTLLEAPIGLSSLGINRNSAMHEADTKLAIRASAAAIVSHRTKPRWKTKNKHSSDWRGICWRVFWGISKHEDRFWIQEIWSPSLSSALCRLFKTCLGGLFEYCVPPCLLWLLQWSEFPAAEIPNKQSGSQGKGVEGSQAHLKVQLYHTCETFTAALPSKTNENEWKRGLRIRSFCNANCQLIIWGLSIQAQSQGASHRKCACVISVWERRRRCSGTEGQFVKLQGTSWMLHAQDSKGQQGLWQAAKPLVQKPIPVGNPSRM